jgi:cellulose synthase (UDP-forming)
MTLLLEKKWSRSRGLRQNRPHASFERDPASLKMPADGLLVDVLSKRQRLHFRALVVAWAMSLLVFYTWWFRGEHIESWIRFAVNSLLQTWTLGLPGYFIFFVSRMKRVSSKLAVPDSWRVAMVTTRAPSEPIEVVTKTLEAMLAQEYPHDTWLADEDPTDEIVCWCDEHGVQLSTRRDATEYHREQWPRRAKCKEGNLAYFYDHHGYERYEFVVQLDADHVPTVGYLEAMLRPFVDPAVGYVSAPSICSTNANSSWSARGRLFAESVMHGPLQAGYSNGFAPLCIGSHYAVRTCALREIGGLGPELAEDHSTTLMMNGNGWRGVHALDAIACGEGPPTLADCITQEFQWARSLMVVMLTVLPKYWNRLSWPLRFQFLFSQLWYPIFGGTMLCGLTLPVVAIVTKQPWVRVSYTDFLLHSFPVTCLSLAILAFLQRQKLLRPVEAPLCSWEAVLFQLVRWPWAVYGSLMGVVMVVRQRNVEFRVTPKGVSHPESLRWRVLLPYIVVVVLSCIPVLLVGDAGDASGYYFFLILSQILYVLTLFSIVLIHRHEIKNLNR